MPSESLVSQTVIGYSTAPESVYGTNPVTAATFTPMVTRARTLPVPDSAKTDDRGVVGRGNAMYPTYQRSGFRVPTAMEFTDTVQVSSIAPLIRRYMGKVAAAPTVTEAATAFLHKFYELDPDIGGLQLPSSSILYQNNEYDFIHTGVVGSTLAVQQQGVTDPTYTLAAVGNGNAKRVSVLGGFGSIAVPAQDQYVYGPSSDCVYTNDLATTINLTTPSHKLRMLQFSANNHLMTSDERMGMPAVDPTVPRIGWYRDFLHFGDREVSASFTTGMDGDYTLLSAQQLNSNYTNFTWSMYGDFIGASILNRYMMQIIIPKFNLRTPVTAEDNAKMTKGFTIFPLVNATHYGLYHIELLNGIATAIS